MNRIQEKDDEDEDYEYAVKRDKADEYDWEEWFFTSVYVFLSLILFY